MLISFILAAFHSIAQAGPPELPLADSPEGFGLGMAVGEPTGLAWAVRPDSISTYAGVLGWSLTYQQIHLHADYQYSFAQITLDPDTDLVIRLSAGPGVSVDLGGQLNSFPLLGVRLPLAFTLVPGQKPFDVFMEVAPVMGVLPETRFSIQGSAGARVFFR